MKGIGTIRLLGEKRIKIFILGMLLLIPGLLLFFTLLIHLTIPGNFILPIFLCLIFGILLVISIYLLFNTSKKLIIANLYVGISLFLLSILLYSTFSYVVSKGDAYYIMMMFGFYILTGAITEFILMKKNFYNFKQLGKIGDSFWLYLLGIGVGKGAYEYIKSVYGEGISDIFVAGSLLLLAAAFGFLSIFYINKLVIIIRYEHVINIVYED